MSKKIIANILPEETRVALFEDGKLAEVSVERREGDKAGKMVGNIYKGKVKNVLPGMQAAFVDIGTGKNAFLYLGKQLEPVSYAKGNAPVPGQDMMVQVVKDSIGGKGPRVTDNLTLPGRYVVLMPMAGYIGVSKRIENEEERDRLRQLAEKIRPDEMGLIVRTVAEGRSKEELVKDIDYLYNLWKMLLNRYKLSKAPALLHRDVDLIIRMVRDYLSSDIEEFIIDSEEAYGRVIDLIKFFSPDLASIVKLYANKKNDLDIFSYYDVEKEFGELMERRVDLQSGGYIIIDHTEALTVIDVNTGKYVGDTNLAKTAFETNLEAAAEIIRQIRLRDIGGMIIIDFIDMEDSGHKEAILAVLEEHLKKDRTKTSLVGITKLGLVEMTRKKKRQNLENIMYHDCPCCSGRGRIKSPESILFDIKRELFKIRRRSPNSAGQLLVCVSPDIADFLLKPEVLADMEKYANRALAVEVSEKVSPETFSILWKPD